MRAQEREALQRMYDINPTNRTARDLERLNRFAPTSTPTDRNRATLSSSAGAGAASNNNQFQQQLAINVTTGDIVGGNEKAGQTIAEIAYRTFSDVVETGSALRRVGLQSLNA